MEDTNERVHSSVRARLALSGLGLNDKRFWDAPALLGKWRLVQRPAGEVAVDDRIRRGSVAWGPRVDAGGEAQQGQSVAAARPVSPGAEERPTRWVWEYIGSDKDAPVSRVMPEDVMGPYERHLLRLSGGEPNVYTFAEGGTVDYPQLLAQAAEGEEDDEEGDEGGSRTDVEGPVVA